MSPCHGSHCLPRSWKGKERALPRGDESGDDDPELGQILSMTLVGTSAYDAVYTIPVLLGDSKQNLSLQVDTGSSDLWIASTSCATSPCSQTGGHLYDPSSAKQTNISFSITYVQGQVDGPIVWDELQIGKYLIQNQALSAANNVRDEPLAPNFTGILGLALPLNSYIAENIPPGTTNNPDGAPFSSNLFGIYPASSAPSSRFLSITLERPESDKIPSLLGLGRHPSDIVSDPSKIQYASLVVEASGAYFWKASVRAITVYVDGSPMPISIASNSGGTPTAVVDSGMPIILASTSIANGVYGALGIGPSADGQYYLPCTTPINMTVTLDDRSEIPLHPLDLSTYPPSSSTSSSCIGLIQTYAAGSSVGNVADIILGVPFMRSTYTVMAYDTPDSSGKFPNSTSPSTSAIIRPRLGLLGLTNPTVALEEFNTVRVLNQPLKTSGGGTSGNSGGGVTNASTVGSKKLSVGVEVLIGLVGFFGLCFVLFGARWAYAKRKYKQSSVHSGLDGTTGTGAGSKSRDDFAMEEVAYRLARRSSKSDPYGSSEDTMRALRFSEYKRRKELNSAYTDDSAKTRVNLDDVRLSFHPKDKDHDPERDHEEDEDEMGMKKRGDMEMGYVRVQTHNRSDSEGSDPNDHPPDPPFSPMANQGWDKESLLSTVGKRRSFENRDGPYPHPPALPSHIAASSTMTSTTRIPITETDMNTRDISDHSLAPTRSRTTPRNPSSLYLTSSLSSSSSAPASNPQVHQRTPSGEPGPSMPLLAHTRSESHLSRLVSMDEPLSPSPPQSPPPHHYPHNRISEFGEFGFGSGMFEGRPGSGVAGIGSGSGVRRGSGFNLFNPQLPHPHHSQSAANDHFGTEGNGTRRMSGASSVVTAVGDDPLLPHFGSPPPPLPSSLSSSANATAASASGGFDVGTNQGRGRSGGDGSSGTPAFLPRERSLARGDHGADGQAERSREFLLHSTNASNGHGS